MKHKIGTRNSTSNSRTINKKSVNKVKHCINETKLCQLIQFNLYININDHLIVLDITKYRFYVNQNNYIIKKLCS